MKATRDWTTSWPISWPVMKRNWPKTWNLPATRSPEWESMWKCSKSPHGMTRSYGNYGTCTAMRNLPSSTARSCRSFRNLSLAAMPGSLTRTANWYLPYPMMRMRNSGMKIIRKRTVIGCRYLNMIMWPPRLFSKTGVSAVTACSIPNSGHISIWSRR